MGHPFVVHVQSINQLYLGHKLVGFPSVSSESFWDNFIKSGKEIFFQRKF